MYTSAEMDYTSVNDPVLFMTEPKFRVRSPYMAFHPFIRQIIVTFLQMLCVIIYCKQDEVCSFMQCIYDTHVCLATIEQRNDYV